jgi:hypothetical protein
MRLRPTFLLLAALAAMTTVPATVAFPAIPAAGVAGCLTSAPASHRMVSPSRVVEPVDADAPGGAVGVADPTAGSVRVEVPVVEPVPFDRLPVPLVERLHLRERASHPATAPPSHA